VCGPILTNGKNHPMWPTLISEDISRHVESMCSMTSVVQGQVLGKTVLPIPTATGWMERYENYDRTLAHTIETQVIMWSSLIQKILKQDSSDLLQTGCNPEPDVEIRFWAFRKSNLEGIHHQLQSSSVEIMAKVLEVMDSSYLPAINTLIGNVSNLEEAQDVDLYLRPLDAQLSQLKNNGFIDMEKCTPAVFHTLFLIWTNCQYYQRPARIVVLLQELCNLFIEQASAYLPDDLLHREDTEESLLMIKKVVKALQCVRESYQAQKEKLARQKRYPPWDFPSAMAFSRYNQFMNRILQLENLFETMLEFQMMEKLELGGIRGRFYGEQVAKIHNEFTNHCQALKYSKYNPLDLTSQAFEDDCNTFKRRIADFELRLANLLCLAFKDCTGLESALKMLTIIAPFLERSQIRQLFRPSFILLQQHFKEELENCKFMIKSQLNPKNMAHTSGVLKWAKMLKERIETPWEQFRLLFNHRDMVSLLDQYEEDIYSDWCNGLEQTCLINLNQTLISRNPTSGLISVNFNPKLVVQCYNKLKMTALEVELPLIRAELVSIDLQLAKAETSLTWQDQDCWSFIQSTKHLVQDLAYRVGRAKENSDTIQSIIKDWSKKAMFCRKDNKKGSLIQLESKMDYVSRKYNSMKRDGEFIHQLIQENMVLFHADPASEGWRSYLEYMDELLVEGLFCYINHSLQFFVDNMEIWPSQPPLFEAQLLLNGSVLGFNPSVDRDAGDGLYELVEGLIGDIFKSSMYIQRVAGHLSMETYQDIMDDMPDLSNLRQKIMAKVESVLRKMENYQKCFDCYTHLWQDDRAEFLRQFLRFGRGLSIDELEACGADVLPDSPPTTENFREQIDYYEKLHAEVHQLEDFRVFDGWLRVDCRFFKVSLLNTIKMWSWLFKEHLLTYLMNLEELQTFLQVAVKGLNSPAVKRDHQGFIDVMTHLFAVRDRQSAIDMMFEPLRSTILLLERYGVTIPEVFYTQMEQELPEKWSEVKKLALKVKNEVAPMQSAEVIVLRTRCMDFEVKQAKFRERFKANAPFSYTTLNPYSSLEKSEKAIRDMEREVVELQESTNLFDVTIPDYRDIKLCRQEITVLKELWDIVIYVQSTVENWTKTKWKQINVEQMDAELRSFARDIRKLDKDAHFWDVYVGLDLYVKMLLTSLRVVTQLQSQAIRERHWMQLIRTTKVDFTVSDTTTLENLLALQLHLFEDEVSIIVDKAVKELAIEKIITEISQAWGSMELSYEEHYQTSLPLLKFNEDLIEMLDDHQQSKHVAHFLDRALELQHQLTAADCVLTIWMEVQRTWVYLESIFKSCDDIHQQIPDDELMLDSANTKNLIEATNKQHLFEKLEDLQKLVLCEKGLAEYLETKRIAFPRFYFISSADLLDILSVTVYLPKLFDSMSDLEFNTSGVLHNPKHALGMYSKEREYVQFQTDCFCIGRVEEWLTRLEESMRNCIKVHLSEAVSLYEDRSREQWILEFPSQIALTGSQIWWSNDMELVFRRLEEGFESALKDYNKKQVFQLNILTEMLLGELSPGDRQKIMSVCTVDVHARDIVASLIDQKVTNSQAFQWLSQLRHCWNEKLQQCYVNICDAQFLYSYEYIGNTSRLVITPLTDCYITLTQSLHLNMSGAPTGPAGTGKTETTKDLGRAMAVMVYIFNCSEQMDYKSMGNIYKGLAQTGAWGCFDEFNRIPVDVLSVVAVQIKTIQDAVRSKKEFLFLNQNISLKKSVGIFITMNPGYAGRAELPENLKALFPCAMVVPDTELICEIMLVAEGFRSAKLLARKFTTLYSLCTELLSKQDHYDWGLRAVKSVLVLAGSLRRKDKTRPEDQVLMRALRDFNMPKIVTEDVTAFLGLLGDLFPGLEVERERNFELEKVIRESTVQLGLQPEETFILKAVQLEELMAVRHSVFVIGSAGTGK
uniref:Dynein, axonemal, heavy chain 11 n=1 Tax=Xiphophorus couchianus TaxID=32473 RepID=A0A3B5KZ49_9TELE